MGLLEAMGCARPAVATAVGGVPEIAGETVPMVAPGDDRGLGQAERVAQLDLQGADGDDAAPAGGQAVGRADPAVALQVSNALLQIAGGTVAQFQSNMAPFEWQWAATRANAVPESKKNGPNPAAQLTALARYEYFNQEYAAADKTRAEALSFAEDKATKAQVKTQLDAAEKQARQIGKQIDAAKKQAGKQKGQQLEDPFGSLGSGSATTTP